MRRLPVIIGAVAVILYLLWSSIFIVDERKQALVLQFGQVKQIVNEPGLGFKIPFIQDVAYYEDRILALETSELEVTPADERRLVVDAFARWRIVDVVQFRQAAQTESNALQRLRSILNASLREVLGSVPSADVLSPERTVLMSRIRDVARRQARALGVEVVDVRIRQADLPEQNLAATFNRMNAEREREARDERARGQERALELRSKADREAIELISDAQRRADIVRGEADAERNRIYAEAFGRDPEFFAFYRSLRAYENALGNSTMVISPDSEFFEYLKSNSLSAPLSPPVVAPGTGETPSEDRSDAGAPEAPADGDGSAATNRSTVSPVRGGDDRDGTAPSGATGGDGN